MSAKTPVRVGDLPGTRPVEVRSPPACEADPVPLCRISVTSLSMSHAAHHARALTVDCKVSHPEKLCEDRKSVIRARAMPWQGLGRRTGGAVPKHGNPAHAGALRRPKGEIGQQPEAEGRCVG